MVHIKEISATYSRKVQISQYEPMEIAETVTGVPEEGESHDEAYDQLYKEARDNVERKLTHRLAAKKLEEKDEK
mgnify:CR=1 FL=1